ncbi:unnamed protein product [Spirodela intermedia]|uniref:Uncharacterized protein n=1 Tax=Spirodela intermedia TaxID=51605 RepID=A0A7I8ISI1_SPIIN|nr:unnamed protein product [Spirodela intermedia]CAA6660770.1 unnamed protein product [Spirodela intermedia]
MEVGRVSGASSSGLHSKRRLFIAFGMLLGGGDSSPGGSGKIVTFQLSSGCHPMERSWMEEVATHLLADRPLPDDSFLSPSHDAFFSRLMLAVKNFCFSTHFNRKCMKWRELTIKM